MKHPKADRAGGTIAAALGLLSMMEAIRLYPDGQGWISGDHTYPALLGVGLFVLGMMIGAGFRAESFPISFPGRKESLRMGSCVLVMLGYCVLLPYLGYVLCTWLAGVGLFMLFGSRSVWLSLLYSLILTAMLQVIFVQWLHMSFPRGILGL